MATVRELSQYIPLSKACQSIGVPHATYYRYIREKPRTEKKQHSVRKWSKLRLTDSERKEALSVLNSERFYDKAPAAIVMTLLEEGHYICSIRTMYRILHEEKAVKERRRNHVRRNYKKPELLAEKSNQVWSWDITKLKGPRKWTYFYLYVIIDIFSRYVVGWMIAERESGELAKELIETTVERQQIEPGSLVIHSDRGSPMKSKQVSGLFTDLCITKSYSRPHVSNDNPFSESQFKTLKYQPVFPERFGCLEDAKSISSHLLNWYNNEHRHSGIEYLTPKTVHYGNADTLLEKRCLALQKAYNKHPERFKYNRPIVRPLSKTVWINKPPGKDF